MTMSTVAGSCVNFSVESTGGTWSWSVVSRNIQGVGPQYEVIDINTPWGPLFQTAIPLPGDVVTAMGDSLTGVLNQTAPLLALLAWEPTDYVLTITEGDPNQSVADLLFQNVGAFGSYLIASASSSVPWLSPQPGQVGGLGKNQQGMTAVTLITGTLLESGSPYSGIINLQDNRTPPTLIPITFSVTVLPQPVISVAPATLSFVYYQGADSVTGPFNFDVSNSGPASSLLSWSATKVNSAAWLSLSPTSGGPLASGSSDTVTATVDKTLVPALTGVYNETIQVASPNASNSPVDVSVELTVAP